MTRFGQTGELNDLDQAIDAGRKAVAAVKSGGFLQLTNLGIALRSGSEQTGNLADLQEAIDACREAVARLPAHHPERGQYLSNLGIALWASYRRTGTFEHLREAVSVLRNASEASLDHLSGHGAVGLGGPPRALAGLRDPGQLTHQGSSLGERHRGGGPGGHLPHARRHGFPGHPQIGVPGRQAMTALAAVIPGAANGHWPSTVSRALSR